MTTISNHIRVDGPIDWVFDLVTTTRFWPRWHPATEAVSGDELADEDRVVIRYRGQGTHAAEFLGIPATGRPIDYTGLLLVRLEGGRIAEFWAQPDQLGLLRQLGATPYNATQ